MTSTFCSPEAGNRADVNLERCEFVGSYVKLPDTEQAAKASKNKRRLLKLGITSALEEIEGEELDKIVVVIVPQFGSVSVGGISIKLINTDVNSV